MRNLGDTLSPHNYSATFVRSGTRGRKKNVLLVAIRDDGDHMLCEHLWVAACKELDRLAAGDVISFIATPVRYIKGYSGQSHAMSDFVIGITLADIHRVHVIGHNPVIEKNLAERHTS